MMYVQEEPASNKQVEMTDEEKFKRAQETIAKAESVSDEDFWLFLSYK